MTQFRPDPGAFHPPAYKLDIPPTLLAYEALDLTPLEEKASEYMQHDLSLSAVYLTDVAGPQPANLTPVMAQWIDWIGAVRQPAVDAVRNAFHQDAVPNGAHGQFLDAELQRIEFELVRNKREVLRHHLERHGNAYAEVQRKTVEVNRLNQAYGQMRANLGGREPVVVRPWLYITALLTILVTESFVNYEAFLSVKFFTPFTALGATLLVAFAIAAAGHYHGTLLKQWRHYFGEHNHDITRGPAWRMFGLGSVALAAALSAVWYARGIHLGELMAIQDALGERGDLSQLTTVGGSLLLNVIVYLCGVFIAWWAHDEEPEYPKLKVQLEKEQNALNALSRRLEKEVDRDLRQAQAISDKAREQALAFNELQKRGANFHFSQELLTRLRAKDQQVLSTLRKYRNQLVQQMNPQSHVIYAAEEYPIGKYTALTPDEYQRTAIKMTYL